MKISDVFKKAARRFVNFPFRGCCHAINSVTNGRGYAGTYYNALKKLYLDGFLLESDYPWGRNFKDKESQLQRSLALLFAAEYYRKPRHKKGKRK